MTRHSLPFIAIAIAIAIAFTSQLSAFQPPPPRVHTVTEKGELHLLPATSSSRVAPQVSIEVIGNERVIIANGIPNHMTGEFPNRGNPNSISAQRHEFRVPVNPEVADEVTPMQGMFGVAVNGIPFEPGAGEFFDGEPGWQYEPLSGAVQLGLDVSHAHVQPTGKYHYHGIPTGLLQEIEFDPDKHSPLIGWAADGFPIYAALGYSDPADPESDVISLTSSYRLKEGTRPGGDAPGGKYDGTFVRDYEYVEGAGDLDECNGRETVTPEFPDGTYAYFVTENWPVIPRSFRGTPSRDFSHRGRQGGGRGGPGQRMPGAERVPRGQRPGPGGQGPGRIRGGDRPRPGQLIPDFLARELRLTAGQQEELDELQAMIDEKLEQILTAEQLERLQLPPTGPPQRGQRGPRNRR